MMAILQSTVAKRAAEAAFVFPKPSVDDCYVLVGRLSTHAVSYTSGLSS